MKNHLALPLISIALTGCAASGAQYHDHMRSLAAPAPEATRLVLYRTGESGMASARGARVKIDEVEAGSVAYKGFNVFDVAAGSHVLAVDIWDAPGSCKLAVQAGRGEQRYFEIMPRQSAMVAGMLGGLVGAAIESSGKECGGTFEIGEVAPATAEQALPSLKLSD